MSRCFFSGETIQKGKGITYVKKDGTMYTFASSKCKKNFLKLKREGRRQKWTVTSREFKERQLGGTKAVVDKKTGGKKGTSGKKSNK
ncbi:50S ribosomal protein L24e [Candidatus Micrarchaeota archaeon]|nr:50S ribosomal protein L24e [Candidatus Micrarchaeota archaeon]MBU1165800.1 50S ribosomal protein L24e [Candidatus Micrarchaeota archaeon]MBU1886284.1 50S ribosomal protein L24e [Candidatus Micrarchaeota archaeon]